MASSRTREPSITSIRQILYALRWAQRHRAGRMPVPEFEHLRRFLGPTDVAFDVGAHGGSWTSALSKAVPQGRVFAFEALPCYAGALRLTAWLCGWRNVEVINRAVMDQPRPVKMIWRDAAGHRLTGTTHVAGATDADGDLVAVEGLTLDQCYQSLGPPPPRVRFVKIDVEGFELPVLRGATRLIDECRPLFWCELWADYTKRFGYAPADMFRFFTDRSYQTFVIDPTAGLSPTRAEKYPGRGDILAIPREEQV